MKINLQNIKSCSLGLLAIVLGTGFSWAQTTFNYTGAVQTYTVPAGVTSISISAAGAQGGSAGGLGAEMTGDFAVTPGEVLTIIVGQEGLIQVGGNVQNSSGGGGGSFVINGSNVLQVAAGGGGGKCNWTSAVALHADAHGKITANGGDDSSGTFLGGTAGNGGGEGQWGGTACAGGGTGWTTQGGGPYGGMGLVGSWIGGTPFCAGGGGGCGGYGGYGGGGGGGNHYGGGGGGGGYSGGAGGGDPDHGGGGGSFSLGTNQVNTPGTHTGDGVIVIGLACTATVLTADLATLSTINGECSSTPTAPTATNDCSTTIVGIPDVAFPITAQGTTTVTWTYNDGVSTITQTQDVVLIDITDPVPDIATLSDVTNVTCYLDTIVPPTATDNCAGTLVGTTTTTFPITAGGTTTITWTFDDGNGNVVTQNQDVINPTVDVSVTQAGTMLTANSTGSVYQWVDCDNNYSVIPNEYNQSYTPAVTGNYAVIVMDSVCSDTSACYLVDYTGIEEMVFGDKEVVKIIDLMGRETEFKMNTPLIFIYSDGTRKRVMEIGK